MARECNPDVSTPCGCGSGKFREYRCGDCLLSPLVCAACLVASHASEPFHWAEKWDGSCFEQVDMSSLGLVVHLGHSGQQCPAENPKSYLLKVIDVNGFHDTKVVYCTCKLSMGVEKSIQLARHGLLPSAPKYPEVAFTFRCMEDFHLHNLTSRKTAYDYIKKLGRKTNEFTRSSSTVCSVNTLSSSCPNNSLSLLRYMRLSSSGWLDFGAS